LPRLSGIPGKLLMPLVLPALVAASRCRMNSDRNDITRFSAQQIFGSPTNSDSYASFAIGSPTQAKFADRPVRPGGMVIG
jgi:hypothetical protein